ncbi:hypothetical protein V6N13_114598 [Hibiscus sabdariffa]
MNGNFGATDISGCLRDDQSRVLISFSKFVGVTDATSTELLAAIEAFKLYKNSRWMNKVKQIIETDNMLIVGWLKGSQTCLGVFKPLFSNCKKLFCRHGLGDTICVERRQLLS